MKKIMLMLITVATGYMQANAQMWAIDKAHTQVMFSVSHMVISEVSGSFKLYSGSVLASNADFSDAIVDFTIDANSVSTDNEMRDKHLKSDDFFNSDKYPKITFKGKGLKKVSGNQYKLTGDLTIRDVTKPVTLDVIYFGTVKDPWGNNKAGFKVKGMLNRFDYNLKWDTATEAGGAMVGKDVEIAINMELSQPVVTKSN